MIAGVIIVEKRSQSLFIDGDEVSEILSVYREPHLTSLRSVLMQARNGEYESALTELYIYAEKNPEMGNCHEVAHGVGIAAARSDKSDDALLRSASKACDAAFLHSVVMQRLITHPVAKRSEKAIELCMVNRNLDPLMQRECVHGLGHAAWRIYDRDGLKGYKSLCSSLPTNMRTECATGIMMDWSLGWRENENILPVVNNPRELCDVFPAEDAIRCPFYIADISLGLKAGKIIKEEDIKEYLQWCLNHPFRLENNDWLLECGSATGAALHSNSERKIAFDALQSYNFTRETLLKFIALSWPRALYWGNLVTQSQLCDDLKAEKIICEEGKRYLSGSEEIVINQS
jgi:hypothetical protein